MDSWKKVSHKSFVTGSPTNHPPSRDPSEFMSYSSRERDIRMWWVSKTSHDGVPSEKLTN